jgi:hypothetical protein
VRNVWLWAVIVVACANCSWAMYGPSLVRADVSIAARACKEGHFDEGQRIVNAIRNGKPGEILLVLGDALKEWNATSVTSDQFNALYAARAFCIHELVPAQLPPDGSNATLAVSRPPDEVRKFHDLGIEYIYYSPDGAWTLQKDPVDLNLLAKDFLDLEWGRQAFLMMTELGWSQGGCREGPDQFREVIKRSEIFLKQYPNSEVSDDVRLELANAYATWWNVSQSDADAYTAPKAYEVGAHEAKQRAIELYQNYLSKHQSSPDDVRDRLTKLQQNPKGSSKYDYYCPDYED